MKAKKNPGRRQVRRAVQREQTATERWRAEKGRVVAAPTIGTPAQLRALVDVEKWKKALVVMDAIAVTVVKVLLDAYVATVQELEDLRGCSSPVPNGAGASSGMNSGTKGTSGT